MVDRRVLSEFRYAVDSARKTGWQVEKWLDGDSRELSTMITEERIHCITRMSNHLASELEVEGKRFAGLDALQDATEETRQCIGKEGLTVRKLGCVRLIRCCSAYENDCPHNPWCNADWRAAGAKEPGAETRANNNRQRSGDPTSIRTMDSPSRCLPRPRRVTMVAIATSMSIPFGWKTEQSLICAPSTSLWIARPRWPICGTKRIATKIRRSR